MEGTGEAITNLADLPLRCEGDICFSKAHGLPTPKGTGSTFNIYLHRDGTFDAKVEAFRFRVSGKADFDVNVLLQGSWALAILGCMQEIRITVLRYVLIGKDAIKGQYPTPTTWLSPPPEATSVVTFPYDGMFVNFFNWNLDSGWEVQKVQRKM